MWRRSSGRMVHWHVWKRARPLINYYMVDTLPFPSDMRDFVSVPDIWREFPTQIRMAHHLHWKSCVIWTMHVQNGKRSITLISACMAHHWSLQLINLQSAYRNVLESFRVLQIRTTLQTAITYMWRRKWAHSINWNSNPSSRSFLRAERSVMWKFRTCRIISRLFFRSSATSMTISCTRS